MKRLTVTAIALSMTAAAAFAAGHATPGVEASDQDVSNGVVSADMVVAGENGWMVVHRTDADRGSADDAATCTVGDAVGEEIITGVAHLWRVANLPVNDFGHPILRLRENFERE